MRAGFEEAILGGGGQEINHGLDADGDGLAGRKTLHAGSFAAGRGVGELQRDLAREFAAVRGRTERETFGQDEIG